MRSIPSLVARLMTHLRCEGSGVPESERQHNNGTDDNLRVVKFGHGMGGYSAKDALEDWWREFIREGHLTQSRPRSQMAVLGSTRLSMQQRVSKSTSLPVLKRKVWIPIKCGCSTTRSAGLTCQLSSIRQSGNLLSCLQVVLHVSHMLCTRTRAMLCECKSRIILGKACRKTRQDRI